ncbi:MAG: 50S ribosomal protein L21 [Patescibacteria group bacterium]
MAKVEEKETKEKNNAFAVIETGGKQYKVSEGDVITIEKLPGEYKTGDKVVFDSVLMTDDGEKANIGEPYIEKAQVNAEFVEEGRNKKIAVMRYRAKSRHFKNKGHKQPHAKVRIVSIK